MIDALHLQVCDKSVNVIQYAKIIRTYVEASFINEDKECFNRLICVHQY